MKNPGNEVAVLTAEDTVNLYDLSMLEEMDDDEYLLEVLDVFLSETPKEIYEMKEALRAGDTATLCKKAHKIKGSAGIINADNLVSLLEDIEATGKTGTIDNELVCLIDIVFFQYNSIEKALKMHMETLR